MKPENARPFDPHNRPLKGEWVVLDPNADTAQMSAPIGDAEVGYTQAVDAIKRTAAEKKPLNIGVIAIVAIVVAAIVYFVVNRMGGEGDKPKTSLSTSTNTTDIEKGGAAADGAPQFKRNASLQTDKGSRRTFVYDFDLHLEGAELDPANPLTFEASGGKVVEQRVEDGKLFVVVDRTGPGKLVVTGLNPKKGARPTVSVPQFDEDIAWNSARPGEK